MNDTALQADMPAADLPPVKLNRSVAFATIHGERGPNDRYAAVHFIQDGLPFDAQGVCIIDHPDVLVPGKEGDARRKALERKLKKAIANKAKERPRKAAVAESGDLQDEPETDVEEDEDEGTEPIDLVAWLMGEQEVEWNEITQEIARRYKKRIAKIEDAVAFLVTEERLVNKPLLRKKFQKMID